MSEFRPSPFQPSGRPSQEAVRAVQHAAARAGSIERLVSEEGTALLATLTPEARELAELTADVRAHGVESPLEARSTANGLELLAGHRRLAAARLAGLADVTVRVLGDVPDHQAAMIVFRRNRLRTDFTPWQEAVSLLQLRERRRTAGVADDSVRSLASLMGYSVGRASELLTMARAFPAAVLARVSSLAGVDAGEALARLPYRTLRALTQITDVDRRVAATVQMIGGNSSAPGSDAPRASAADPTPAFRSDGRRGGGFTITVFKPVEAISAQEAAPLIELLERTLAKLRERRDGS